MATDERARLQLYKKLEEKLGPEEAAILIDHLPPAGWGDVARRQDVDALRAEMDHRLGRTQEHFDAKLERELRRQTRWFMASQAVFVAAVIAKA